MFWELRTSARNLLRSPGFSSAAVATFALGIGGTVAMFSIVHAVVLRPLAYPDSDRLISIREVVAKVSHLYPSIPVTAGHFDRWEKRMKSFDGIGAMTATTRNLTGSGDPERLGVVWTTVGLFSALGVQPQLGRWFTAEEGKPGGPDVVVISDSLWRRRFLADPAIVGKRIVLDGVPYEIVGVFPAGMPFPKGHELHPLVSLPRRADVFQPVRFTARDLVEHDFNYAVIARLRPGVAIDQARAEIAVHMAELGQQGEERFEVQALIEPLHSVIAGGSRQSLFVLLGAVGFVLLIVCVNVANLTLVRVNRRRRELAIRAALGASLTGLIRHSLSESLVLCCAGGLMGSLLALWIVDLVKKTAPIEVPRLDEASVDGAVLLFSLCISVLAALVSGLLPALRSAAAAPRDTLETGSRGNTEGVRGVRTRGALIGLEVALSTVLLITAGLFLRSFIKIIGVERGFDTENIVAVDLSLPTSKYQERAAANAFFRRVRDSVRDLAGVAQAGYVSILPLTLESDISMVIKEGAQHLPMVEQPVSTFRTVSPEYFPAFGIPLRRGRLFVEDGEKERVVVIGESVAARVWPGENAIGKRFARGGTDVKDPANWWRVIGVAGDVRAKGLDREPEHIVYMPYWQRGASDLSLVVRTAVHPSAVAASIRQRVWRVDPDVPVPPIRTMEKILSESVAQRKFQAILVAVFAFVAMLLASIGIYGVVAYAVAGRRAELGVRIALGATAPQLRRLIISQGMWPIAAGLGAGLPAAAAVAHLLRGFLFGVSALDPLSFSAVPLLLLAVSLLACLLPAWRAGRIDPMHALRYE